MGIAMDLALEFQRKREKEKGLMESRWRLKPDSQKVDWLNYQKAEMVKSVPGNEKGHPQITEA
jgi:hypothetical protein